jgi:hypothetical protein
MRHACVVCHEEFPSLQELERHLNEVHPDHATSSEDLLGTPVAGGRPTGAATGGTSGTDEELREGYDTGDWGQGERGGRDAAKVGDVGDQGDLHDTGDVHDLQEVGDQGDVLDQMDVGGGTGPVATGTGTGTGSEVVDLPRDEGAESSCEYCGRSFTSREELEEHYQQAHGEERRIA